jgi:hypothetical protein
MYLGFLNLRGLRISLWLVGRRKFGSRIFFFIFEGGMSLSVDIITGSDMSWFKSGDSTQERVTR